MLHLILLIYRQGQYRRSDQLRQVSGSGYEQCLDLDVSTSELTAAELLQ